MGTKESRITISIFALKSVLHAQNQIAVIQFSILIILISRFFQWTCIHLFLCYPTRQNWLPANPSSACCCRSSLYDVLTNVGSHCTVNTWNPCNAAGLRSKFTLLLVYGPSSVAAARGPFFMTHPPTPSAPCSDGNPLCTWLGGKCAR